MAGDLEVTPEWVRDHAGEVQLIDVREDYEWEAGRIEGARHVELDQIAAEAASVDKERPVVFYCLAGSRSLMAASAFQNAGYEAYSMAGGLAAWAANDLPLDPPDGKVAPH